MERLERAALGAEGMGDGATAEKLRATATRLPQVRSAEQAAEVAGELRPVADVAWELGRRCGGHDITPALREKAQSLAERVKAGEITRERAVEELAKE
ncbi:MAG: hypothetical protein Q8P59_09935 [Dehalococcoidia bacterium]|nr:hypothetical protein [Dehalococcoidia bacterium]